MSKVVVPQSDIFIPTGDQINKIRYRVVNDNRNLYSDWSVINFVEQTTLYVPPPGTGALPPGGNTGDYPVKTGPGDYDVGWVPQPFIPGPGDYVAPADNHDLPAGGDTDQVLTKISPADYDATWMDAPVSIPPGGLTGEALVKTSALDGAVDWAAIAGANAQDANFVIGMQLLA